MLAFAFIITLSFLALVLGVHTYSRYINPGLPGMKKEVIKLRSEARRMADDLIPIDRNELDLLSAKVVNRQLKGRIFGRKSRGYIPSIYDEPLLAFIVKRYPKRSKKTIYYVRSSNSEIVIIKGRKGAQLYIDGHPVGMVQDGKILERKQNRKLGELVSLPSLPEEVKVGNKKVATLNSDVDTKSVHPRLFTFINPVSADEKRVLLALVVCKLLVYND